MGKVVSLLALLVVASILGSVVEANSLILGTSGLAMSDTSGNTVDIGDTEYKTMGTSTSDLTNMVKSQFVFGDNTPNKCFGFKYEN